MGCYVSPVAFLFLFQPQINKTKASVAALKEDGNKSNKESGAKHVRVGVIL